jgi:hypothetical protein
MKVMMITVSGTHNNDPLAYVDRAKTTVKNIVGVHRLALYYFFVKCEEFPRVDDEFASSLPEDIKGSSNKKPSSEIVLSTPSAARTSISGSRSSSKKANTNDFSDASVQAFKDIAETMKQKHCTDKMFRLLSMDGVSPNTKRSIQEALLNDFRSQHGVPAAAKKQKTTPAVDQYRDTHHNHRPIVAEDYVCGTTVDSSDEDDDLLPTMQSVNPDDDDETSHTKDPDGQSETIL